MWEKPYIDLKPALVMINNFKFGDYDKLVDRHMKVRVSSRLTPQLYVECMYEEIETYVKEEAKAVIEVLKKIYKLLKDSHIIFTSLA